MGADDFRALLEPGAIRAVFQPIVRLAGLDVIGYEGLSRFPPPPGLVALPPDVTLAAAESAGLRDELEVACLAAIAAAGVPPHGRALWVNLSPEALGHPGLLEVAGRLTSRLVIELTEQDAVLNHALLRRRLQPWIERGALVAVDDAGAGFTSLEYVADIRPDFLKLSRGMVAGIDADAGREAVLRATAAFAREVGARVVAEGVERVEELEALRAMEIDYGQGWLFGRPSPPWPQDAAPVPAAPLRVGAGDRLERDLERAESPRDACEAVVDHLARRGLLPSVWLAQSGRLRCQAVRGFWQVFDGVPPTTGILGRVYRTGEPAFIDDVGEAPEYLPAIAGVRSEICIPLRVAGAVVGVLDAESVTTHDDSTAAEVQRCAALLAARLEEVGALPPASPAQRLARAAARLAVLRDPEDVVREALAASLDLSGYESGLLALADGHGALYVHLAEGPFAVAFSQFAADELAAVARWVDDGTSSYTVGDVAGRGFPGHEVLRRLGAGSLIVLPVTAAGERLGVILLADRANRRPVFEDVELLELLAGQAAGSLRMASAVAQLRERASRDPLTGLHASLPVLPARAGVVIADVDGLGAINDARGQAAGDDVLRSLAGLVRELTPAGGRAFRIGDDAFVVTLDAPQAVSAERLGWELRSLAPARLGTTLSVGVAVGRPGESGEAVVLRAGAALNEAKRLGGNAVAAD
ncbi:EAL domain-containing protein [Candidatus Solirubrobacter pratensis]|uniref:EAL domain-containing protein n=1 Tax=Candidatus Solirubrobacter pratensis TaxID=1298857 RepID=UPI0004196C53|nr:EAL domain-containing protein [Candidatus Solirubrobacter pratensis]